MRVHTESRNIEQRGGKVDKKQLKAFRDIEERVIAESGIAMIDMWELREAGGWAKLGANVVKHLATLLDEVGLGTLPVDAVLPLDQNAKVRIYQQKSPVGQVVEAVTEPSHKGDDVLRRLAAGDEADVLLKIRELLGA